MNPRYKKPHPVNVLGLGLGGDNPVRIQSMWKSPLKKVDSELVRRIGLLSQSGCELLRFAVPDMGTAELLGQLSERVDIPLVADIHFDHKIALACIGKAAKIRINPGNIGARWKVQAVVQKAKDNNVPIRVGINAGSLPPSLRHEQDKASAMIKAAEEELDKLESLAYRDIVFSLKSSDIKTTVRANEMFAARHSYPLHIGVTEAGPLVAGIVRSTVALTALLEQNIGSTVRVSLSGSCADEVYAAREILRASGRSRGGVTVVSCPQCGRAALDVHGFLQSAQEWLLTIDKEITVAVMGCVVNGPEEARHADVGITSTGKKAVIFRGGVMVRKVDPEQALTAFKEEIEALCSEL